MKFQSKFIKATAALLCFTFSITNTLAFGDSSIIAESFQHNSRHLNSAHVGNTLGQRLNLAREAGLVAAAGKAEIRQSDRIDTAPVFRAIRSMSELRSDNPQLQLNERAVRARLEQFLKKWEGEEGADYIRFFVGPEQPTGVWLKRDSVQTNFVDRVVAILKAHAKYQDLDLIFRSRTQYDRRPDGVIGAARVLKIFPRKKARAVPTHNKTSGEFIHGQVGAAQTSDEYSRNPSTKVRAELRAQSLNAKITSTNGKPKQNSWQLIKDFPALRSRFENAGVSSNLIVRFQDQWAGMANGENKRFTVEEETPGSGIIYGIKVVAHSDLVGRDIQFQKRTKTTGWNVLQKWRINAERTTRSELRQENSRMRITQERLFTERAASRRVARIDQWFQRYHDDYDMNWNPEFFASKHETFVDRIKAQLRDFEIENEAIDIAIEQSMSVLIAGVPGGIIRACVKRFTGMLHRHIYGPVSTEEMNDRMRRFKEKIDQSLQSAPSLDEKRRLMRGYRLKHGYLWIDSVRTSFEELPVDHSTASTVKVIGPREMKIHQIAGYFENILHRKRGLLTDQKDHEILKFLVGRLTDSDPWVVKAAVWGINRVADRMDPVLKQFILERYYEILGGNHSEVARGSIARSIREVFNPQSLDVALEMLKTEQTEWVQTYLVEVIQTIVSQSDKKSLRYKHSRDIIEQLLEKAVGDPDAKRSHIMLRVGSIKALAELLWHDQEVLDDLKKIVLTEPDSTIQEVAMWALARLHVATPEGMAQIDSLLETLTAYLEGNHEGRKNVFLEQYARRLLFWLQRFSSNRDLKAKILSIKHANPDFSLVEKIILGGLNQIEKYTKRLKLLESANWIFELFQSVIFRHVPSGSARALTAYHDRLKAQAKRDAVYFRGRAMNPVVLLDIDAILPKEGDEAAKASESDHVFDILKSFMDKGWSVVAADRYREERDAAYFNVAQGAEMKLKSKVLRQAIKFLASNRPIRIPSKDWSRGKRHQRMSGLLVPVPGEPIIVLVHGPELWMVKDIMPGTFSGIVSVGDYKDASNGVYLDKLIDAIEKKTNGRIIQREPLRSELRNIEVLPQDINEISRESLAKANRAALELSINQGSSRTVGPKGASAEPSARAELRQFRVVYPEDDGGEEEESRPDSFELLIKHARDRRQSRVNAKEPATVQNPSREPLQALFEHLRRRRGASDKSKSNSELRSILTGLTTASASRRSAAKSELRAEADEARVWKSKIALTLEAPPGKPDAEKLYAYEIAGRKFIIFNDREDGEGHAIEMTPEGNIDLEVHDPFLDLMVSELLPWVFASAFNNARHELGAGINRIIFGQLESDPSARLEAEVEVAFGIGRGKPSFVSFGPNDWVELPERGSPMHVVNPKDGSIKGQESVDMQAVPALITLAKVFHNEARSEVEFYIARRFQSISNFLQAFRLYVESETGKKVLFNFFLHNLFIERVGENELPAGKIPNLSANSTDSDKVKQAIRFSTISGSEAIVHDVGLVNTMLDSLRTLIVGGENSASGDFISILMKQEFSDWTHVDTIMSASQSWGHALPRFDGYRVNFKKISYATDPDRRVTKARLKFSVIDPAQSEIMTGFVDIDSTQLRSELRSSPIAPSTIQDADATHRRSELRISDLTPDNLKFAAEIKRRLAKLSVIEDVDIKTFLVAAAKLADPKRTHILSAQEEALIATYNKVGPDPSFVMLGQGAVALNSENAKRMYQLVAELLKKKLLNQFVDEIIAERHPSPKAAAVPEPVTERVPEKPASELKLDNKQEKIVSLLAKAIKMDGGRLRHFFDAIEELGSEDAEDFDLTKDEQEAVDFFNGWYEQRTQEKGAIALRSSLAVEINQTLSLLNADAKESFIAAILTKRQALIAKAKQAKAAPAKAEEKPAPVAAQTSEAPVKPSQAARINTPFDAHNQSGASQSSAADSKKPSYGLGPDADLVAERLLAIRTHKTQDFTFTQLVSKIRQGARINVDDMRLLHILDVLSSHSQRPVIKMKKKKGETIWRIATTSGEGKSIDTADKTMDKADESGFMARLKKRLGRSELRQEANLISNVLIVEDDPDVSGLLQFAIQRLKIAVAVADKAEDALELIRKSPDLYDAIFLDNTLKGKLTGIELVKILQDEARLNQSVIVWSSGQTNETLTELDRYEAAGILVNGSKGRLTPIDERMEMAKQALTKRRARSDAPGSDAKSELRNDPPLGGIRQERSIREEFYSMLPELTNPDSGQVEWALEYFVELIGSLRGNLSASSSKALKGEFARRIIGTLDPDYFSTEKIVNLLVSLHEIILGPMTMAMSAALDPLAPDGKRQFVLKLLLKGARQSSQIANSINGNQIFKREAHSHQHAPDDSRLMQQIQQAAQQKASDRPDLIQIDSLITRNPYVVNLRRAGQAIAMREQLLQRQEVRTAVNSTEAEVFFELNEDELTSAHWRLSQDDVWQVWSDGVWLKAGSQIFTHDRQGKILLQIQEVSADKVQVSVRAVPSLIVRKVDFPIIKSRSSVRPSSQLSDESRSELRIAFNDFVARPEILQEDLRDELLLKRNLAQVINEPKTRAELLQIKTGNFIQRTISGMPVIFEKTNERIDILTGERVIEIQFDVIAVNQAPESGNVEIRAKTDGKLFGELSIDITPEALAELSAVIDASFTADASHVDRKLIRQSTQDMIVFTQNAFFGDEGNLALIAERLAAVYGRYFVIVTSQAQLRTIQQINQKLKPGRQIIAVSNYQKAKTLITDRFQKQMYVVGVERDRAFLEGVLKEERHDIWNKSKIDYLLAGFESLIVQLQAAMLLAESA